MEGREGRMEEEGGSEVWKGRMSGKGEGKGRGERREMSVAYLIEAEVEC